MWASQTKTAFMRGEPVGVLGAPAKRSVLIWGFGSGPTPRANPMSRSEALAESIVMLLGETRYGARRFGLSGQNNP